MATLICGNCGYPAVDPAGCGLCQGPVFDLSTAQGVLDCRTYRTLRGEQAQKGPMAYLGLVIYLVVMAVSGVALYVADVSLGDMGVCEWCLILALVFVGSGLLTWYFRWTRLSKEQELDVRLWRPDPFHDPNAKEPPRAARRPPNGVAA
ncbi:MAG: hypothetical protein HY906_09255 [Deltaproteobacteria bacterium]|nr:hypothetical protein [Deltaproteobacteria bacterium]